MAALHFLFKVCAANKIKADGMFVLFEANGGNHAFYFFILRK